MIPEIRWRRVGVALGAIVLGYGWLCATTTTADQVLRQRGTWPGYRRGDAKQIAIAGDYAYVAAGGLQVVSLRSPAELRVVGGILTGSDLRQVAVAGNVAACIDHQSLKIVDVSDPTALKLWSAQTNPARFGSVALAGRCAYLTYSYPPDSAGIHLIDLSDPARPRSVGKLATDQRTEQVKAYGDRLYAQEGARLNLYDLADPFQPRLAGSFLHSRAIAAFAVAGNRAYLTDSQGLAIVDWSDSAHPQALGTWTPATGLSRLGLTESGLRRACSPPAYSVAVDGPYAYLGGGTSGLVVLDVRDPARPRLVTHYEQASDSTLDVAVSAGIVLLANGSAGLEAVSAADPTVLKPLGVCVSAGRVDKLVIKDRYAYLVGYSGGLTVIDVSDPDRPRWVYEYPVAGSRFGMAVKGDRALLVNYPVGLDVLDLTRADRPERVGRYENGLASVGLSDVSVEGDRACALNAGGTLQLLDVTDLAHPTLLSQIQASPGAQRVNVVGSRAYLAAEGSGLRVVDISQPTRLRVPVVWSPGLTVKQVAVAGDYAFAATDQGLRALSLSDPFHAREVGVLDEDQSLSDVLVAGNLAYLAGLRGVGVADISDPAHPRPVGSAASLPASALALAGQRLYVSLGADGLLVLDAYEPPPRLSVQADASGYRVTLQAETGQTVLLQRSEDLQTWADWQQTVSTGGPQVFLDRNDARISARYYRAVLMPEENGAVHLLQRYPTMLTEGDPRAEFARVWEFSANDIYHLNRFNLRVGPGLEVQTGAADLGIGHGADGALWAVVIPRAEGTLASASLPQGEAVRHLWLRFHPQQIETLFPPETVRTNGDARLMAQMAAIARWKLEASWEADGKALIPSPRDLVVDADTQSGLRRFFAVDTQAQTAQYNAALLSRAVPVAPALDLAQDAFDQLWQAFGRQYPLFAFRPEVDWAQTRERFRPRALASATTYEFATVCAEMLRTLRDLEVGLSLAGEKLPVYEEARFLNANPNALGALLGGVHPGDAGLSWSLTAEGVGYVAVSSWSASDLAAAFDAALDRMLYTRGLIVDARSAADGDPAAAGNIAARFLARESVYGYFQLRQGTHSGELGPRQPRLLAPRGPWCYDRPVRLLIGRHCQGAGEAFAAMLSTAPQTVTLGDRTAGAGGRPETLALPLSLTVRLPQSIEYGPDGTPLDGQGIAPQMAFTNTAAAFQGHRDDLLSLALEDLRQATWPETAITNTAARLNPPVVVWTYPGAAATNVPREVELRLRFDRPMAPSLFHLTWREGGFTWWGTPRYEADRREFVFPVRLSAGRHRLLLSDEGTAQDGFLSAEGVAAKSASWEFSTQPEPTPVAGPKPTLLSVSPAPGSTVSVLTFVGLTFDRPLMAPERSFPYLEVLTSSTVSSPGIVNRIVLDETGCRLTVPFYAPVGTNRTAILRGLRSADGVPANQVQLSYTVSTNLLPAEYLARTDAALTNAALLQLVQRMKQARCQMTALEETVQLCTSYRSGGWLNELAGSQLTFKWRRDGAFLADASPLTGSQAMKLGGDGQRCWWQRGSGTFCRLVAGPTADIQERNVAICDPFRFTTDSEAQALAEIRPVYLGLRALDGRLCHVLEAWDVSRVGTNVAFASLVEWWIDADDLRSVEVRRFHNHGQDHLVYRYDSLNQPIDDALFAVPEIPGRTPAPLDSLDADYTTRFFEVMDGSNGQLCVVWGKKGPKYSSSTGFQ